VTQNNDALSALSHSAVILDRTDRARVLVTGASSAKFLHNLTTNEIKRLAVGRGVEAFVTSPQGKTLAFVTVYAEPGGGHLVRSDPDGLRLGLPHLQKYGVFDDVAIDDLAPTTAELHLAGPDARSMLEARAGLTLPEPGELRLTVNPAAHGPIRLIAESPLGVPGFTLIGHPDDLADLDLEPNAPGLPRVDSETAESLRIEAGTPAYGRDLTPDNLPQEVARDSTAINFVKGCYLGQETVARIDALGHVNKTLRGLRLTDDDPTPPAPGSPLEFGGKGVGAITSSAVSPRRGVAVALGYVRTAASAAGTEVTVIDGGRRRPAVVVDLPMSPA